MAFVPLPQAFCSLPIAHRALHERSAGRPENSRAAIAAAIAAGYAIEIDLQLAADGRAMVFHDDMLDRLTEAAGPLRARTSGELAQICLRDGSGETVPLFSEVLSLVAGRVPLLVEVKDQDGGLGPEVGALEDAAARDLASYIGPVALMSFNPHSVAALAQVAPLLPRGIVTSAYRPEDWPEIAPDVRDRLRGIPDYERVGASFISHEWRDLDRPRVSELAKEGAAVLCWTVRSEADEAVARRVACNVTFESYLARRA